MTTRMCTSLFRKTPCLLGITLVLAGCGPKSNEGTATSGGSTPPGSTTTPTASTPTSGKIHTIGLTVQTIENPFFVAIQTGTEAEGKKIGATTTLQDGRHDIGNQTNIIENFIQQ